MYLKRQYKTNNLHIFNGTLTDFIALDATEDSIDFGATVLGTVFEALFIAAVEASPSSSAHETKAAFHKSLEEPW